MSEVIDPAPGTDSIAPPPLKKNAKYVEFVKTNKNLTEDEKDFVVVS